MLLRVVPSAVLDGIAEPAQLAYPLAAVYRSVSLEHSEGRQFSAGLQVGKYLHPLDEEDVELGLSGSMVYKNMVIIIVSSIMGLMVA